MKKKLTKEEIARKLLHLFALLMPAGIFYLPHPEMTRLLGFEIPYAVPVGILAFLFFGSVIVEQLRFRSEAVQKLFFRYFGHMLRKEESTKITGSTYVMGAALACSLLFANHRHISFMALSMFILGDAVAALAGIGMGRIRIGKKSLEGSLACFSLCVVLFYAFFANMPWLLDSWIDRGITDGAFLLITLAASLSVTVFELVPLKITKKLTINDNLAVPVIAGAVMLLMEKVLV